MIIFISASFPGIGTIFKFPVFHESVGALGTVPVFEIVLFLRGLLILVWGLFRVKKILLPSFSICALQVP